MKLQARTLLIAFVLALAVPSAHALEIIFFQDFGCDGGSNDDCGAATTPQSWTQVNSNPDRYVSNNPNYAGVTETINSDNSTRIEGNPSNFSVTGRNWDIHDGDDNQWVSGYKDPDTDADNRNPNMSGNMLGHEDENYDYHEDNYYQIDGIQLSSLLTDIQLMFDYDSWIDSDVDAFGVAFSTDGGNDFNILNPTNDSDMQYRDVGTSSDDQSLNYLLGESSGTVRGFDGMEPGGDMAGTAMFDLSGFAGQTLSLRFAFATNSSGSLKEGINIDNIKVTGVCTSGSGPDCDQPPGTGVPEPGSLALAMLGLTALYRRRQRVLAA